MVRKKVLTNSSKNNLNMANDIINF